MLKSGSSFGMLFRVQSKLLCFLMFPLFWFVFHEESEFVVAYSARTQREQQ